MGRGLELDDARPGHASAPADLRSGGGAAEAPRRPGRLRADRRGDPARPRALVPLPSGRHRDPLVHEGRCYRLRDTESRTLETLATFRLAIDRDLVEGVYAGDRGRFAGDLRSLTDQGLIAHRAYAADRQGHSVRVLTLTQRGQQLLRHRRGSPSSAAGSDRPVYGGWGKAADLVHEASLYRMYLTAVGPLAEQGASVRRVVLDAELKRRLYRETNRARDLTEETRRQRLAELAHREGLPVVDGHVQLPDLRIEYRHDGR